jgi:pyruvate carboxylase subunit B
MRTEDMVELAEEMDKVGFHSMEVWGGATYDVAIRFLHEDPWERPRILKKLMPNTPLQMLLRGQNLVGYRHYADDVVEAFVHHAAEVGIDIFRVFDALNDERNLQTSVNAIKANGKHAQLAICYSLTQPKMGGPVFNLEYYTSKALVLQEMGADSICIKDMAGLLAPDDAYLLVSVLKKALNIPIQLHIHYTSGMGSMACLKAIEAGIDVIDTALAPFALRSSQPAIEPIVATLRDTPRDTGLDLVQLMKLGERLESIAASYKNLLNTTRMSIIDTGVLVHQIPGGMTTNLVTQLKQNKVLHRLDEVHQEIPQLRKELGYPPLVTPTSQSVGAQAVSNVIAGRYKVVSSQFTDYCYGAYGKPPAEIDPEVQSTILTRYRKGQEPITCRPADLLEPEMDKAREAIKDFSEDMGDILIYALYPISGLEFLKDKYGLDTETYTGK